MPFNSMGLIGGGRVARCILGGFSRKQAWSGKVIVSEPNQEAASKLKKIYPDLEFGDNRRAASADIVFLALHPPVMKDVLTDIASVLGSQAVLVSLAPKIKLSMMTELTGGFKRVMRMIPNAPSIVNAGFNPVSFPEDFPAGDKSALLSLFGSLGDCPEVAEETLEAFAITTAMGPTYLWFQLQHLQQMAESFGLPAELARKAMASMTQGALKTFYESALLPDEVKDLVPVKPLAPEEENIRLMYETSLRDLYGKLTS